MQVCVGGKPAEEDFDRRCGSRAADAVVADVVLVRELHGLLALDELPVL